MFASHVLLFIRRITVFYIDKDSKPVEKSIWGKELFKKDTSVTVVDI